MTTKKQVEEHQLKFAPRNSKYEKSKGLAGCHDKKCLEELIELDISKPAADLNEKKAQLVSAPRKLINPETDRPIPGVFQYEYRLRKQAPGSTPEKPKFTNEFVQESGRDKIFTKTVIDHSVWPEEHLKNEVSVIMMHYRESVRIDKPFGTAIEGGKRRLRDYIAAPNDDPADIYLIEMIVGPPPENDLLTYYFLGK